MVMFQAKETETQKIYIPNERQKQLREKQRKE